MSNPSQPPHVPSTSAPPGAMFDLFDDATLQAVDAWASRHGVTRTQAIGRLVRLGLTVPPVAASARTARCDRAIELAATQIGELIGPDAPSDERRRRIARLLEGPPEFVDARIDLPKRRD